MHLYGSFIVGNLRFDSVPGEAIVTQPAASICSRNIREKLQPSKAAAAGSRRASAPIPSGLCEAQLRSCRRLWICGRGACCRAGGAIRLVP